MSSLARKGLIILVFSILIISAFLTVKNEMVEAHSGTSTYKVDTKK